MEFLVFLLDDSIRKKENKKMERENSVLRCQKSRNQITSPSNINRYKAIDINCCCLYHFNRKVRRTQKIRQAFCNSWHSTRVIPLEIHFITCRRLQLMSKYIHDIYTVRTGRHCDNFIDEMAFMCLGFPVPLWITIVFYGGISIFYL